MYGTEDYGVNQYASELQMTAGEVKPYKPDLLSYITPMLRASQVFKSWDAASGYEIGLLKLNSNELLEQFFIATATWGIAYWEKQYGIPTDLNKSYEDRREVIKAKMRGSGTTTTQMIKNTAEAFSGGDVNIIEHPESYSFTVQFVGVLGIPKNLEAFKEMLETIKPAHLGYEFKYTYTVWDFIKNKPEIWDNVKINTWDNLKIFSDKNKLLET